MSLENRITNLLNRVPGYMGYRDKENRRDDDKRLRESIAASIRESQNSLTQYNARLSSARELASLGKVETLVSQMRLLSDRIRTASYGYGGIFTERSVDSAALDQLRQFDISMQQEIGSLPELIAAIASSIPPTDTAIQALTREIDRLGLLFSARTSVIDNATPSRDEKVLALLDTTAPVAPSSLLAVRRGDTLSVLGDNFVANTTITVTTVSGTLHLIRVTEDAEDATWLLGSGMRGIPSARLTQSPGHATSGTLQSGTAAIDSDKGKQDAVAVQYLVNVDAGQVTVTLVIGNSTQTYRGEEIRDIDVEVYGAA